MFFDAEDVGLFSKSEERMLDVSGRWQMCNDVCSDVNGCLAPDFSGTRGCKESLHITCTLTYIMTTMIPVVGCGLTCRRGKGESTEI